MHKKLLIVDDEPYIRLLLEQTLEELEEEGVELLMAQDGEEALEMIREEEPALVFIDFNIPKKNGVQVCKIVKQDFGMSHVYVVLLTGKGQEEDRKKGLEAGADQYLTKPFDPAQVMKLAREVLEKSSKAETAPLNAPEESIQKTSSPQKLLIVDDEATIRLLLEQSLEDLEDEGIELLQASNGQEALEVIQQMQPQMVILDVMMPLMNGMEVCRVVKRDWKMEEIFIVLLTARGQELDRKKGLEVGANEYMTKPFDPDTLLDLAKKVFEI